MSTTREEAKKAKTTESKDSKYIERLLVTAEKRKKEYERRIERQVQKEREAEGDKYKDKEVFVTSTYRAKLEEMKKAEEADEREAYLENIGDVTKQKDLDGFYRHLYEQKMGNEKAESAVKNEQPVAENEATTSKDAAESISKQKKQRTYRRRLSNDDEENEGERKDDGGGSKAHLASNLDADSDFSIDSESDDDSKPGDGEKPKKISDEKPLVLVDQAEPVEENVVAKTDTPTEAKAPEHDFAKPDAVGDKKESTPEPEEGPLEVREVKIKIDIWKKRTVGDVFDAALQRYYERKQLRAN